MRNTALTRSNARSGFATQHVEEAAANWIQRHLCPGSFTREFSGFSGFVHSLTCSSGTIAAPCCQRRGSETTLLSAPQQTLALLPSVCATAHAAATVVPELE